jgi:hypothetical protein
MIAVVAVLVESKKRQTQFIGREVLGPYGLGDPSTTTRLATRQNLAGG